MRTDLALALATGPALSSGLISGDQGTVLDSKGGKQLSYWSGHGRHHRERSELLQRVLSTRTSEQERREHAGQDEREAEAHPGQHWQCPGRGRRSAFGELRLRHREARGQGWEVMNTRPRACFPNLVPNFEHQYPS